MRFNDKQKKIISGVVALAMLVPVVWGIVMTFMPAA